MPRCPPGGRCVLPTLVGLGLLANDLIDTALSQAGGDGHVPSTERIAQRESEHPIVTLVIAAGDPVVERPQLVHVLGLYSRLNERRQISRPEILVRQALMAVTPRHRSIIDYRRRERPGDAADWQPSSGSDRARLGKARAARALKARPSGSRSRATSRVLGTSASRTSRCCWVGSTGSPFADFDADLLRPEVAIESTLAWRRESSERAAGTHVEGELTSAAGRGWGSINCPSRCERRGVINPAGQASRGRRDGSRG